jgi:hypothetical protein
MKNTLRAATGMIVLTVAGAAFAATPCTADVARMKRLEDRSLAIPSSADLAKSGLTLTTAKRLDGPGMVVPSAAPVGGLSLADAKRLDRLPAPGRARDIAGSCL